MVNMFFDLQANSHVPPIQPQARIWKSHMANAIPINSLLNGESMLIIVNLICQWIFIPPKAV